MQKDEMRNLLVEYMGKGFLENIISLIKTDASLFELIPDLLKEENMRVRLGAVALVEEFLPSNPAALRAILPRLIKLLKHHLPNVRGDVAYALGILKDPGAIPALKELLADETAAVRESAKEALADIEGKGV
ncbi:MAG TPA: hypothetical protein DCS42_05810 [Nitrospiraceae bacterium]|jgi:HEAT repeat protein|nr:hypothetical protein [Nitrospiraceae bacterium]HAS53669.1 hypothetical protein [Nitrospiraceae bacterium]